MSQKKDNKRILFFRESVFKVAELIFNHPNKSFHIRALAEKTRFSTTAVTSAIKELEKFDIVTIEKTKITTNIQANLKSEAYTFYKRIFNLYRIERYNLLQILKDAYSARTIVLFGSFAKGEDVEESDIDLLILSNKKQRINLSKYEKTFNRKINLHILSSLEKSEDAFKNAIANGVVLHGYIKVI